MSGVETPGYGRGSRFVCPECGKKGVTLRLRANGEDHYGCRYCEWEAFSVGNATVDVEGRAALAAANPDHAAAIVYDATPYDD